MDRFIRHATSVLAVITIGVALTVFGFSEGWAQEKRTITYKIPAAISKYTQQHVIDVGDVPGHQIRILEVHRTFSANPPVYEGVKAVEEWVRGSSDYINLNGRASGYGYLILENGDKIFSRWDGTSQTTVNADGSRRSTFNGVSTITGGTGKFRGIRGTLRASIVFDPKAGLNEGQTEGEYWIEE